MEILIALLVVAIVVFYVKRFFLGSHRDCTGFGFCGAVVAAIVVFLNGGVISFGSIMVLCILAAIWFLRSEGFWGNVLFGATVGLLSYAMYLLFGGVGSGWYIGASFVVFFLMYWAYSAKVLSSIFSIFGFVLSIMTAPFRMVKVQSNKKELRKNRQSFDEAFARKLGSN